MANRRKAWVHQVASQVRKHGADVASWYVSWVDPDHRQKRKSYGAGKQGKRAAEQAADKIHAQLLTGTYDATEDRTWAEFREMYDKRVLALLEPHSRVLANRSLDSFERIVRPSSVSRIKFESIDLFISKRAAEKTNRKANGGKVSPATVNSDLRHIMAAFKRAVDWGMLSGVPRVKKLREPRKLPTYVSPRHFKAMYKAAGTAKYPNNLPNGVTAEQYWQGLLFFAFMTGWRIGQIMALQWADVDLEAGTALSRAEDNKGGRDERIQLHPEVVARLRPLAHTFAPTVFHWTMSRSAHDRQFKALQEAAVLDDGKPLPMEGKNGARFMFHDLRRGFATANAEGMDLFELQQLMQHRCLDTTRGYVAMAEKINRAVAGLYVPDVG